MRRNCPYCNNKPCVCPGYPFGPVSIPGKPIGRPPMRPYEGDVFVFNWPHPPLPRHKPIRFDPEPGVDWPGGK